MCGVRYRTVGPGQTEVCPHTAAIEHVATVVAQCAYWFAGSHPRSLMCSDGAEASQWCEQAQGRRIV